MSETVHAAETRYETLRLTRDGAVDWLTLNRPERLNAMDNRMCDELQDYFGGLYTRHATRVVVLRGAGRGFCAGFDLKAPQEVSAGPAPGLRAQQRVTEVILRMRRCPQPIVCLVHGAAAGGGLALALASDIRIAAASARMNVGMVLLGLTGCDAGISYFLPRAVGTSVAAELMMTGRFIGAERALRVGLVSDVVAEDGLEAAGRALAGEMLRTAPLGLRLTKEGLGLALDAPSLEAAVTIEDRGQILCASGGYFREGMAAFREGRAPSYPDE
ncbi:MAG: enoyl-CoA hydratase [Candidatus Rokubacteria bacterium RIFCSPLOWO2_12_FULL_71_19]|nr:MAG: enoyl-CoA hydratase [Candidatus Rokubacteria bacterium RIFCSPLOWO2_12_FULL_71_19]